MFCVVHPRANTYTKWSILHATTRRDHISRLPYGASDLALERKGSHKTTTTTTTTTTITTTMKTAALLLAAAAAPVLAHTVTLSESPVATTATSSLRGGASAPHSSSSSSTPSQVEDARRSLQQLQPDQSCYFYGAPGELTNVTCTTSLLSKCDQLMSSNCAPTQQEAIDDATYPCATFTVWYQNDDSCTWALVCCDNP